MHIIKHLLLTTLFLASAVLLLRMLGELSPVPSVDYWTAADQLLHFDGLHLTSFFSYFIRLNEHVIPITGFIYAMNILATGGSNQGLIVVAFVASFFSVVTLYRLIPEKLRSGYLSSLVCGLCVSLFIFSCAPYAVWYEGFSGVHWQVATFFMVLSLFWFHDFSKNQKLFTLFVSLGSATLACLTYSSAYVLWPVLFCLAVLYRFSLKSIALIVLSMAPVVLFGVYFAYDFGFEVKAHPAHNPAPLITDPLVVLKYFLAYIGAYFFNFKYYFTNHITGPVIVATVGLILFVTLTLLSIIRNHRSQFPWIGLAGIALGNGVLTALIRGEFGTGMMVAPRFKCITVLFWLSLFVLLFSSIAPSEGKKRGWKVFLTVFMLSVGVWHSYYTSLTFRGELRKKALEMRLRDTAALSYRLGSLDQKIFESTVTRNIRQMDNLRERLVFTKHVPFRDVDRLCADKLLPAHRISDSGDSSVNIQKGKKVRNGLRLSVKDSELLAPFSTLCLFSEKRALVGVLERRNLFRATRSNKDRFSGYVHTLNSTGLTLYGLPSSAHDNALSFVAHVTLPVSSLDK